MSAAARCPVCDSPLEPRRRQSVGEDGGVAVAVEAPTRACPQGHEQDGTNPPAHVRDEVLALLPTASRSRLRRRDRCAACATLLSMPTRRTRRSVSVTSPAGGVATATFDLAMTRCPACGHDQATASAARHARRALDDARSGGDVTDRDA